MSFFPNKTREQIAALTDQEIDRVINFACAERGVPVFLEAPVEPKLDCPPDIKLFTVSGEQLLDKAEADALAEFINGLKSRVSTQYGYNYTVSVVQERERGLANVGISLAYSIGKAAETKRAREVYDAAKREFDVALEAYRKATRARDEVVAEVWDEVSAARAAVRRVEQLKDLFAKYTALANGDRRMAFKFLKQAHTVTDEQAEAIGAGEFLTPPAPAETPAESPAEVAPSPQ